MSKFGDTMSNIGGGIVVFLFLGGWIFIGPVYNFITGNDDATSSRVETNEDVDTAPEDYVDTAEADTAPDYSEDFDQVNSSVDDTTDCDPNYDPCVPNVSYDLDCPDIGFRVEVIGDDVNRFDADNDGIGCESY